MPVCEHKRDIFVKNVKIQRSSKCRQFIKKYIFRKKIVFHALFLQEKYVYDLGSEHRSLKRNFDLCTIYCIDFSFKIVMSTPKFKLT